jgi:hypothetical protein
VSYTRPPRTEQSASGRWPTGDNRGVDISRGPESVRARPRAGSCQAGRSFPRNRERWDRRARPIGSSVESGIRTKLPPPTFSLTFFVP